MNAARPCFDYVPAGRSLADAPEERSIVVVGAGLVGLTLAIDLRLRGIDVLLLERTDTVSTGSRSICQAKRTLEIWDRLGVGEAIRDRGVTWKVGRVFHGTSELYEFDLLPEAGHKMPAFVNLQQYHVEAILHSRYAELGGAIRFLNEFASVESQADGALITVNTPEGPYRVETEWLISCEGVRSTARHALGLKFEGEVFRDKFLIADVKMHSDFPAERWFWFRPPFHDGQTALLHKQADDIWRIDLQLGRDSSELERYPDRARARIEQMLGHDNFDFVWLSVYAFQCRTLEQYVHGRVIFAGDSAHQVSPFGARGGNGGVQDADNLGWKLAAVVNKTATPQLLASYDHERRAAAAENILNSTLATSFMTPASAASQILRDETLRLAAEVPFARSLVNSGRLSQPAHYFGSPLNTPDDAVWKTSVQPGSPAVDAPICRGGKPCHLVEQLGSHFTLLAGADNAELPPRLSTHEDEVEVLVLGRDVTDGEGLVGARYDVHGSNVILFRPDQHVAMRRRRFDAGEVAAAVRRCRGQ